MIVAYSLFGFSLFMSLVSLYSADRAAQLIGKRLWTIWGDQA